MKIIICIFLIISYGTQIGATEINFTWKPNVENVDGYNLYMDYGTHLIANIDEECTSYKYNVFNDKICHSFALSATQGDFESKLSEFVIWCPEKSSSKFFILINNQK